MKTIVDRQSGEILDLHLSEFDNSKHRLVYTSDKPTKTKQDQQFVDEANLNVMIKRYGALGLLQRNIDNLQRPNLGDVTDMPTDYQEMLMKSAQVKLNFALLPAVEREKYGNDPAQYMDSLLKAELEALKAVSDETGVAPPENNAGDVQPANKPVEAPQ